VGLDRSGRQWRKKPLGERLLPAWVYLGMAVMSLAFGIWCWTGVDETPLERSRVVALVFWLMTPIHAWLAVLSRRLRARR